TREPLGLLSKEIDDVRSQRHLALSLAEPLALLEREDVRDRRAARPNQLSCRRDDAEALERQRARPERKSLHRRGDRCPELLRAGDRQSPEQRLVCGVDDRQISRRARAEPAAVDVQAQLRILHLCRHLTSHATLWDNTWLSKLSSSRARTRTLALMVRTKARRMNRPRRRPP